MKPDNFLLIESFFLHQCRDSLPVFINSIKADDMKTCAKILVKQCEIIQLETQKPVDLEKRDLEDLLRLVIKHEQTLLARLRVCKARGNPPDV